MNRIPQGVVDGSEAGGAGVARPVHLHRRRLQREAAEPVPASGAPDALQHHAQVTVIMRDARLTLDGSADKGDGVAAPAVVVSDEPQEMQGRGATRVACNDLFAGSASGLKIPSPMVPRRDLETPLFPEMICVSCANSVREGP